MDTNETKTKGISSSGYATKRRQLHEVINSVRAGGAQADIDLPRIVAIGNQSAGKSSLVEAISQVRIPRGEGTCTRCPLELRMQGTSQDSGAWSCQIKLRLEYGIGGERVANVRETNFGTLLSDPDDVEPMLRKAQLAILNPHVPPERLANIDLETLKDGKYDSDQQEFSRNLVCLDIKGREVTDLTFVDLPGIISNGEPATIGLIRDLAKLYIQENNCLILLTLTMKDDVENQSAALLAREVDPLGKRTIGVLTKPDTLQAGDEGEWIKIISGDKHELLHGYYLTKQPSPLERKRNISFKEARELEMMVMNRSPWTDLPGGSRGRLGTQALISALSELLTSIIAETLPHLIASLNEAHTKVNSRLQALPATPSGDPSTELLSLCNTLVEMLNKSVQGAPSKEHLLRSTNNIYAGLKKEVRGSMPLFVPFTKQEQEQDKEKAKEKEKQKAGAAAAITPSPPPPAPNGMVKTSASNDLPNPKPHPFIATPASRAPAASFAPSPFGTASTPDKRGNSASFGTTTNGNNFPSASAFSDPSFASHAKHGFQQTDPPTFTFLGSAATAPSKSMSQANGTPAPQTQKAVGVKRKTPMQEWAEPEELIGDLSPAEIKEQKGMKRSRMDLTDVRKHISNSITRELPFNIPFSAKVSLLLQPTELWGRAIREAFESVNVILCRTFMEQVATVFGRFTFGMLRAVIENIVQEQIEIHSSRCSESLAKLIRRQTVPYTQNTHYFSQTRENLLASYKSARHSLTANESPNDTDMARVKKEKLTQALALLTEAGYVGVVEQDLPKLLASDAWEQELIVCAETTAYLKIAYKRIIDEVPMTIDDEFFRPLPKAIQDALLARLEISNRQRAEEYLQEDPSVSRERSELMAKKTRIKKAQAAFNSFGAQ